MSQGIHSISEQYAIMDRIKTIGSAVASRLYDGIPDWVEVEFDEHGILRPFPAVTFGIPIRTGRNRSLLGAVHQPYIQPFTVDCWAGSADDARRLASAVVEVLTGFMPDDENATEIEMSGGGDFRERDTEGRPSRYCKRVQGEYQINMHTPDV